ncbi:unnamed protein product [Prunus armeniaca]
MTTAAQRHLNGDSKGGDGVEGGGRGGRGGLSWELRVGRGENKRKFGVLERRNWVCGEAMAGGYAGHYFFSSDLAQNDVVLPRHFVDHLVCSSKRSHQQL